MKAGASIPFTKLEALGNDFVLIDARTSDLELPADRIRRLADRRRGIGFDQLLVLRRCDRHDALCRVEIFNSDASSAEQCGNGMRAVALWLHRHGQLEGQARLITAGGLVQIGWTDAGHITASLAEPDFSPAAWGGRFSQSRWTESIEGREYPAHGLSMGNPHVVVEWPHSPSTEELIQAGVHFSDDPRLSRGANIGLAHVVGPDRIELAVHERGTGPTLACGSGACAAAVVLLADKQVSAPVRVRQQGGELVINWPGVGHPVEMTGPAQHVFDGILPSENPAET